MDTTCRYYKRLSADVYQPYASSKRDMRCRLQPWEQWCKTCRAVVELEGKLDVTGITQVCPFCRTEGRR